MTSSTTAGGLVADNDLLRPRDKLKLGRFFAAGLRDSLRNPEELDQHSVTAYAKDHGGERPGRARR